MVKCYYSSICHIYYIIITELLDIDKDIALQIAFKVINNFIVVKQVAALKKAIEEVKKLKAKC